MKRYFLTYTSGKTEQADENDVLCCAPTSNEDDILLLEVGEFLVDEDGDTWERIA